MAPGKKQFPVAMWPRELSEMLTLTLGLISVIMTKAHADCTQRVAEGHVYHPQFLQTGSTVSNLLPETNFSPGHMGKQKLPPDIVCAFMSHI